MLTTAAPLEKVARPSVPDLDAILGEPIRVLDDGFVRVVDYMATTRPSCRRRGRSYGQGHEAAQHEDRGLIRYLMRHAPPPPPFEMCELKLHVARADGRVAAVDPPPHGQRERVLHSILRGDSTRPSGRRQGRGGCNRPPNSPGAAADCCRSSRAWQLVGRGRQASAAGTRHLRGAARPPRCPRGRRARTCPCRPTREAYWKIDLQNLLHFLELRMDEHAHSWKSARTPASSGEQIVAKWVPLTPGRRFSTTGGAG